MQKVSLRLRLVLAGAAFFALSGSANETTVTVTGTGRGSVSTIHRHGVFYVTASMSEVQSGAEDLARTAAYDDAREKCDRMNGRLIDSANSRNTTFSQTLPRREDSKSGDPVFVLSAKTTIRCALPPKDARIADRSGAKAHLETHPDGSIWSVSENGQSFRVPVSSDAR